MVSKGFVRITQPVAPTVSEESADDNNGGMATLTDEEMDVMVNDAARAL